MVRRLRSDCKYVYVYVYVVPGSDYIYVLHCMYVYSQSRLIMTTVMYESISSVNESQKTQRAKFRAGRNSGFQDSAKLWGGVLEGVGDIKICLRQSHFETLTIYKPGSRKFSTQDDLYE